MLYRLKSTEFVNFSEQYANIQKVNTLVRITNLYKTRWPRKPTPIVTTTNIGTIIIISTRAAERVQWQGRDALIPPK